jgi:hypothetical protein
MELTRTPWRRRRANAIRVSHAGCAAAIRRLPGTFAAIDRVGAREPLPIASVPARGLSPILSMSSFAVDGGVSQL